MKLVLNLAGKTEVNFKPTTVLEEVQQNILHLFSLKRGEVPYARSKGVDPDIIDQLVDVAKIRFTQNFTKLVKEYEPRAKILKIGWNEANIDGELSPKVLLSVDERYL